MTILGYSAADEGRAYRACLAQIDRDGEALALVIRELGAEQSAWAGLVCALTRVCATVLLDGSGGDVDVASKALRLGLSKLTAEALASGDDLGYREDPDEDADP